MMIRRRALTILALILAVVTLAVSPRALFARPVQIPRWQSSKRAHVPRHMLPQAGIDVARRNCALRRTRADFDRLTDSARAVVSRTQLGSELPRRAAIELAKPRYLRFFEDPQRQTSPPA